MQTPAALPASRALRVERLSEVGVRRDPTVPCGSLERSVVAFVLVGVGLSERHHRLIERVLRAEIGGDRNGVARAGVGSGKGPAADRTVRAQAAWLHQLDLS